MGSGICQGPLLCLSTWGKIRATGNPSSSLSPPGWSIAQWTCPNYSQFCTPFIVSFELMVLENRAVKCSDLFFTVLLYRPLAVQIGTNDISRGWFKNTYISATSIVGEAEEPGRPVSWGLTIDHLLAIGGPDDLHSMGFYHPSSKYRCGAQWVHAGQRRRGRADHLPTTDYIISWGYSNRHYIQSNHPRW